ncbi:MAG: Bax inhibitor-1 family protein [Thermoanaerobaculia bacterium]
MTQTTPADYFQTPVIELGVDRRAAFITRTYVHLFAAILAFAGIEIYLFSSGLAERLAATMLGVSWLWSLGGFMVVGWLASRAAHTAKSLGAQYAALAGYVIANAIIFVPLLYIAQVAAPGAIQSAAVATLVGFGGLTLVAFVTRKDFSFLGALLKWGFVVALILIVAGVLFGFELGTFFSVAMIALAGGAVLYDTSNVLHHFPEDRHVGAALELFASIALMFWYVLRLFISRD